VRALREVSRASGPTGRPIAPQRTVREPPDVARGSLGVVRELPDVVRKPPDVWPGHERLEAPRGDVPLEGISAVIGPCAGVCCYEAGEEVHAAFGNSHRDGPRLDLRAIARERLQAAGVRHIEDLPQCTICDEGLFSHRREGARAGRQAGVAWLS
jgi:hypothetical protein